MKIFIKALIIILVVSNVLSLKGEENSTNDFVLIHETKDLVMKGINILIESDNIQYLVNNINKQYNKEKKLKKNKKLKKEELLLSIKKRVVLNDIYSFFKGRISKDDYKLFTYNSIYLASYDKIIDISKNDPWKFDFVFTRFSSFNIKNPNCLIETNFRKLKIKKGIIFGHAQAKCLSDILKTSYIFYVGDKSDKNDLSTMMYSTLLNKNDDLEHQGRENLGFDRQNGIRKASGEFEDISSEVAKVVKDNKNRGYGILLIDYDKIKSNSKLINSLKHERCVWVYNVINEQMVRNKKNLQVFTDIPNHHNTKNIYDCLDYDNKTSSEELKYDDNNRGFLTKAGSYLNNKLLKKDNNVVYVFSLSNNKDDEFYSNLNSHINNLNRTRKSFDKIVVKDVVDFKNRKILINLTKKSNRKNLKALFIDTESVEDLEELNLEDSEAMEDLVEKGLTLKYINSLKSMYDLAIVKKEIKCTINLDYKSTVKSIKRDSKGCF